MDAAVNTELAAAYVQRLQRWPAAMRRYLYEIDGHGDLACYGPGDHGHWSMQANNTAAAAFAVLAADDSMDPSIAGMSRDEMLHWALRLIRFSLVSHHANNGCTTDGQPWGHSWISGLCLERMMHGLDALGPLLPQRDRDLLDNVLVSESNWLLDCYTHRPGETPGQITAGKISQNYPESNIWNGALLHRTALRMPDAPRAAEYARKGTAFLLNGVSIDADAHSDEIVAGKPISKWHVGANFFPSYALNHHGYLNIGYIAICLSNVAMLHFACLANGWPVAPGLHHHARELWRFLKTCTFPDGRLCRIGGDTRVRYCYCQDYAVPVWLLARDLFDDDVDALERGWLDQIAKEIDAGADKTFLSARLARLESASPLYYARLEADRACSLSMGAYWHRLLARSSPAKAHQRPRRPVVTLAQWSDEHHGSCLIRGKRRLASWTWQAVEPPEGLCLPTAAGGMAEWQGNLAGRVRGMGVLNERTCPKSQTQSFEGGFAACGQVRVQSSIFAAEGNVPHDIATIDLAAVALPDDRTMIVMQRARTLIRVYLREVKGLLLQIPNDVFNGMQRTYSHANGEMKLAGCPGAAQRRPIRGDWLVVDDCLSVVRIYGEPLEIYSPADRQIPIFNNRHHADIACGNLYADEICCGCFNDVRAYPSGDVLFDLGVTLLAGVDARRTAAYCLESPPTVLPTGLDDVRGVRVVGADSAEYAVLANFSDRQVALSVPMPNANMLALVGCEVEPDAGDKSTAVIEPWRTAVIKMMSAR